MTIHSFRRTALIAAVATIVQFFLFKHFYPFPSFFQDSYTYLDVAAHGYSISYRPVGYSMFLILIHFITSSDTALVFVQYCTLQLAGLYLYRSIGLLYSPWKVVRNILFLVLFFNPLSLYLANLVSSDALFTALTLVWLTELLWLMHEPSWGRLIRQLVLLVVIFYIRYNALCYPVITAAAFLFTRKGPGFKIAGIASSVLTLVLGAMVIGQLTKEQTGVRVFSAFSGWQMANNALYVYPYVKVERDRLPSPECRELDSVVAAYFDASGPGRRGHQLVDTWYMWDPGAPLKGYMRLRQRREHTSYFTAWNRVGPVFSQYGFYLLSHHPLVFSREYVWPSARMFFYPPLDVLGRYNEGEGEVDVLAREWFRMKSTKVWARSFTAQGFVLGWAPALYLVLNVAFAIAALLLLLKYGKGEFRAAMVLTGVYFLVNAAFCIFSTPNVFRYQAAPLIWLFVFTLLAYHRVFSPWNPVPAARKG
ncbi:MAG: hypothetical protein J0H07_22325 [Sphingobacteriales bacterium]|nr:hypothetical protein [Sphingobacteriales bacterium]